MSALANGSRDSRVVYRFGDFELVVADETLWRGGTKLNINRRMYQVLLRLIERGGEIVTKQEFFETVWNGSFVEDNNLTVTIAAIRKVLGDDAKKVIFIENLPRKGYRFVALVSIGETRTTTLPALVHREPTAKHPPLKRRGIRLWISAAAACMIVVLVVAAAGYRRFWASGSNRSDHVSSIAVLPFTGSGNDIEYLADGLTEDIITDLGRARELRVIDRNSSFKYKDKRVDPAEAARQLGVASVLVGSIERHEDTLKITIELIDSVSAATSLRREFSLDHDDLISLSQEVVEAVEADLAARPDKAKRRPTTSPEAYDLYLKGRYLWNKRTNTDLQGSLELFRAAIDRDPVFARAHVGLSEAYSLVSLSHLGISDDERIALAKGAIQKALEIDDSIGEAYAAAGINKVFIEWDFAGAEAAYRRALELSPNDATAHHWYAELLSMQGRFDECFAHYETALLLDPLSLPIRTDMAFAHYYAHDNDAAIAELNKAKELDPAYIRTYVFMGFVYREKGMLKESIDMMEHQFQAQFGNNPKARENYEWAVRYTNDLRNSATRSGAKGYWEAEIRSGPSDSIYKAVAYCKIGDIDKAFEFLEKAVEKERTNVVWLKVMPEFDSIRSDPRYDQLLRRVGLA